MSEDHGGFSRSSLADSQEGVAPSYCPFSRPGKDLSGMNIHRILNASTQLRKAGWALLTVLPLLFLELSWHSDSLPARTLPQQTAKHPTVPSCPRAEKPFCAFLGQADICGRSFLGKADICGRSSKQTERDIGLAVDVEKYLSYCLTGGTYSKWFFPDLEVCIFCSPHYSTYLH